MSIVRINKHDPGYVIVSNEILENASISFKAKGLLAYLLSRPANWTVIVGQLSKVSSEGEDAVRTGLTELREAGYATFKKWHDDKGHWDSEWVIYEEPVPQLLADTKANTENPDVENPDVGSPDVEKPDTILRTDPNKELANKELCSDIPTVTKQCGPETAFKKRMKAEMGQDLAEAMLKAREHKGKSYTVPETAGGYSKLGSELIDIFCQATGLNPPQIKLYSRWIFDLVRTVKLWKATDEQAKDALKAMLLDENSEVKWKSYTSPLQTSFQQDYGLFLGRAVSGKTDYRKVGKVEQKDTTIWLDGKE